MKKVSKKIKKNYKKIVFPNVSIDRYKNFKYITIYRNKKKSIK